MARLNVGKLKFERVLQLESPYMTGEDVKAWQQFLSIVDDGVFGPHTDRSTCRMQRMLGLTVDGKVGPKTIAAANRYDDEDEVTLPDIQAVTDTEPAPAPLIAVPSVAELVALFKQATHYTPANRTPADVKHIVIHTAEIGENLQGAEALANVAASPTARKASWHFAVDADSITQSVKVKDVAWHAPGANKTGVGIELSGRARQNPEEWADDFSSKMLELCSKLVAALCHEWDVPPVFVDVPDLRAGKQGITTHNVVSKAFHKSDHWDPGPHFPLDAFLSRVRVHLG